MSAVVVSRSYRTVRLLPAVGDVAASFGLTTVTTQPFVVRGFRTEAPAAVAFEFDDGSALQFDDGSAVEAGAASAALQFDNGATLTFDDGSEMQ